MRMLLPGCRQASDTGASARLLAFGPSLPPKTNPLYFYTKSKLVGENITFVHVIWLLLFKHKPCLPRKGNLWQANTWPALRTELFSDPICGNSQLGMCREGAVARAGTTEPASSPASEPGLLNNIQLGCVSALLHPASCKSAFGWKKARLIALQNSWGRRWLCSSTNDN